MYAGSLPILLTVLAANLRNRNRRVSSMSSVLRLSLQGIIGAIYPKRPNYHTYHPCHPSFSLFVNSFSDLSGRKGLFFPSQLRTQAQNVQNSQIESENLGSRPNRRRGGKGEESRKSLESGESIPSLAEFMHRAKVRKQYRNFIRLAQFMDDKNVNSKKASKITGSSGSGLGAGECRAALEEVRSSYKLGMKKSIDSLSKNMAFSEGERRLRELESMVGFSRSSRSQSTSINSTDSNITPAQVYDDDSWINIRDEEDPRGRVGTGWPWERK